MLTLPNQYDIVVQITSGSVAPNHLLRTLNDFAFTSGWHPSDKLEIPVIKEISNANLLVEHGLENTAVITFMRSPRSYADLAFDEKNKLLGVSYNNLVDWHLCISPDEILFIFNRREPPEIVERRGISRDDVAALRSEVFEQILGKRPNPNLQALDDALISTVSFWKRNLAAELGTAVRNESYSALFNSIIFARAVEDHFPRFAHEGTSTKPSRTLLELWTSEEPLTATLHGLIRTSLGVFGIAKPPDYLLNTESLQVFDKLERSTVLSLLTDFYTNKYAPYEYDFSVMSKHALSRIYEHYVSILRKEETPQLAFFPALPREERDKTFGSIYTPQFIARFFARYLREQLPPGIFRRIASADPACGSGIFLRTLLELQCDPTQDGLTTDQIHAAFRNIFALDVDENASQATRLSLALLHLVLTDSLPSELAVVSDDAIEYFLSHSEMRGRFDAVIANPPFVSLGAQSDLMRNRLSKFLGENALGRKDLYLAFLQLSLDMLKPGGFGLFVLPHSFLLSRSAAGLRKRLSQSTWIRCLADLSAIRVFDDTGSYIVLLIFQKKNPNILEPPPATIVKCHEFVGKALQDVLEGRVVESNFYSVYEMSQEKFAEESWWVLPPSEASIESSLKSLPLINDFLDVRAGFASGADDVFILRRRDVPEGEGELFVPYLPDRQMEAYTVPRNTNFYLFYPFLDGKKIEESTLARKYRKTWSYLIRNKPILEQRLPVKRGVLAWWQPTRPRLPENMLRPKIVSPHLVLMPRFALDPKGKYAVSHGPFLYPKESGGEQDLLKFFLAVLNSSVCYWFVSAHSFKYSKGYTMLEPAPLKNVPVPDPTKVSPRTMSRIVRLVEKRLVSDDSDVAHVEKEIDILVTELYGLSTAERKAIGLD